MSAQIKATTPEERERQKRFRGKNVALAKHGACTGGRHEENKTVNGNRVLCAKCGNLVGFVRDPRKRS